MKNETEVENKKAIMVVEKKVDDKINNLKNDVTCEETSVEKTSESKTPEMEYLEDLKVESVKWFKTMETVYGVQIEDTLLGKDLKKKIDQKVMLDNLEHMYLGAIVLAHQLVGCSNSTKRLIRRLLKTDRVIVVKKKVTNKKTGDTKK